jgi:hypothetical protein
MHMQDQVPPKVIPQVLAHSHHPQQLSPAEDIAIHKSSLRPIDHHRLARKRRSMSLRPPMYLIAFRHR